MPWFKFKRSQSIDGTGPDEDDFEVSIFFLILSVIVELKILTTAT